jgi:integrase
MLSAEDQKVVDTLEKLSKNKLERLQKTVTRIYRQKYKHRKFPKYGFNGAKAMTNPELVNFFNSFYPHEWRMCCFFLVMANSGLRVGEACKIKLKDVDLENKQLYVSSEKQTDEVRHPLFMHKKLEEILKVYIEVYNKEIVSHEGYLFWKAYGFNKHEYMSPDYARKVFRAICDRAGLNAVYGERAKFSQKTTSFPPGNLHTRTTHSLRYWYIRHLGETCPIDVVSLLARHKDIQTTMTYLARDKPTLDLYMEKGFAERVASPVRYS